MPPPPEGALLSVNVLLITVNVPLLSIPPPTPTALLPLNALLAKVFRGPKHQMPPPWDAVLSVNVLLLIVSAAPAMAPPPLVALLSMNLLLATITFPAMPPPSLKLPLARLPVNVLLLTVSDPPSLKMPPPDWEVFPLAMVIFSRLSLTPAGTMKTCTALPPLMVTFRPVPSIVVSAKIVMVAVSVIVPLHVNVTSPPPLTAVSRLASSQLLTTPPDRATG